MYRLFWKLFFSFWLALLLFAGGAIFAVSSYLEHANARQESRIRDEGFEGRLADVQMAADRGGKPGLLAWAQETDEEQLVPFFLLDKDAHDILGRDVSSRANARFQRTLHPREGQQPERRAAVFLPDGQQYWLIPDLQGATLSRLVSRPKVIALQLILATFIGGAVCFALAWYLISPIERLRKAALLYGAGDFKNRVGPTLGRRRDEIVDLAFAMDAMAEQIDALIQSQHTLLRDVSHELRTPLARAQAAAGVARQQTGDAAGPELDRIELEMDRLNELIGQILSYYRLDSSQRLGQMQLFRLDETIREVVEENRPAAAEKQCEIEFAPAPEVSFTGDEALIYSALGNIVQNTVRYSPPHSRIQVGLERSGDGNLKVDISDAGPGVDPDLLERIFEPFVRVDAARSKNTGGFGLGLAIAKRAIDYHGGSIVARNRKTGGLLVTLQLPAKRSQPE